VAEEILSGAVEQTFEVFNPGEPTLSGAHAAAMDLAIRGVEVTPVIVAGADPTDNQTTFSVKQEL
jgi:hypothetical protein